MAAPPYSLSSPLVSVLFPISMLLYYFMYFTIQYAYFFLSYLLGEKTQIVKLPVFELESLPLDVQKVVS